MVPGVGRCIVPDVLVGVFVELVEGENAHRSHGKKAKWRRSGAVLGFTPISGDARSA